MFREEWQDFCAGDWTDNIDVSGFIRRNYRPYDGDEGFLAPASERTAKLWDKCRALLEEEIKRGIYDVDTENVAGIDNFAPGYIDRENEIILGLQTDAPLKRMVNPYGGIRMVKSALQSYGYKLDASTEKFFTDYTKTHNQGVFDAYSSEMILARKAGLITGLPDAYGRGRIVGDYRRVPLYGIDMLMAAKHQDLLELSGPMSDETIRARSEVADQIKALQKLKKMAGSYGIDISEPAENAREAVQFLYLAYLGAVKESNGAAMSLGRVSTFLDIYIERDLERGLISEEEAQELMDQFVVKLRMVRHLRTPEYNELFAGDPNWITEAVGGIAEDGRHMVTKTSYRVIHTLDNLGHAPEPNLTVLWSEKLPLAFKKYCADITIRTDSLQYENDDMMRGLYGDDYSISCCVSAARVGKEMQFFGARCNIVKALLYAINGGVDENLGIEVVPGIRRLDGNVLDYEAVRGNYSRVLVYVAGLYVNTLNLIHYMHDKYAYEAAMMALIDTEVERYMAFGVAGLAVVADSLSAIKYARVKPHRVNGLAVDFEIEGDYPAYGNDDDRVDALAVEVVEEFIGELNKHKTYRNAQATLSVLTITSNLVYGKKTGATPDGRKAGEAFPPGANPVHRRETNGALAALNTIAKIPYGNVCQDGISNTFSVVPQTLGRSEEDRVNNLKFILDAYFAQGGHHLNVNVLNRELLIDAMHNPHKYPSLTIRVSGYAVNFNRLTLEQKQEVIYRTYHEVI